VVQRQARPQRARGALEALVILMGAATSCCLEREARTDQLEFPREKPVARERSLSFKQPPAGNTTTQRCSSPGWPTTWYFCAFACLFLALSWSNPLYEIEVFSNSKVAMVSLVGLLLLLFAVIDRIWSKVMLFMLGISIMLFGRDKRWKKTADPAASAMLFRTGAITSKRVIFVRHGESEWNSVFNQGLFWLPFGLVLGIIKEFLRLLDPDSVFIDSPLNWVGTQQAKDLAMFLRKQAPDTDRDLAALRGDPGAPEAVLVTSNLRRSMETMMIGLWGRLNTTHEKVRVLSCLQEVTTNMDGVALAEAGTIDPLLMLGPKLPNLKAGRFEAPRFFDASENGGQKHLRAKGIDRLANFCQWCFSRQAAPCIIAGGHSFWFRYFFKTYLPNASKHQSKTKKIGNGGVVAFNLERAVDSDGIPVYRIDEASITVVYGGFSTK
jgi:hypothetical protein